MRAFELKRFSSVKKGTVKNNKTKTATQMKPQRCAEMKLFYHRHIQYFYINNALHG